MEKSIFTENLMLRFPCIEDFSELKAFENRNKDHLSKWELTDDFSLDESCQKRLDDWIKECREGKSVRFFIFPKSHLSKIIGMCNYTQIFRGYFQACYLGFKIDQGFEGRGLMFEALKYSIRFMFEEMQFHRIMANYMPINVRKRPIIESVRICH